MAQAPTPEQRIETLARTLRASGLALSDSQAKLMAKDIIGTESKVQKNYDQQHSKANDLLKGASRVDEGVEVKGDSIDKDKLKERVIEEMRTKAMMPRVVHDEIDVTQPLASLVEKDAVLDQIAPPLKPAAQVVAPKTTFTFDDIEDAHAEPEEQPVIPEEDVLAEDTPREEKEDVEEGKTPEEQQAEPAAEQEDAAEEEAHPQEADEAPKDEEEDPNQPEKTRVYTDKVANPKPIDQYEESKVDLSAIFGGKR